MTDTTPRVLLHNDRTDDLLGMTRERFPGIEAEVCKSYGDLPAQIARFRPEVVYTVRFAGSDGYPRDALFGEGGPRWVANGGVGTDHFGQWDPARTTVTNAAGVAADMMAEYILGGFLHFALDVPGMQRDQAARHWDGSRRVRGLAGATLLILGLGHTGRALALRAKAMGMRVIGTRARPQDTPHVDEAAASCDLHRLLPQADFIAVCTPLIPATRGLIGTAEVDLMRPGVVLADVSRGGVVETAALQGGLESGRIGAAACDVFETEPLPAESPLWAAPNLLISPHCSAVHDGWEQASAALFLDNLDRWCRGDELRNIVDPARGY